MKALLVFLLLASGCHHTAAEVRGRVALRCERGRWEGDTCDRYFATKKSYEKSLAESNGRLAALATGSPLEACTLMAQRDFGACVGETPLGSAHPLYGADEENTSACRNRFDVAARVCAVSSGPTKAPSVAKTEE